MIEPAFQIAVSSYLREEHIPTLMATGFFLGVNLQRSATGLRVDYLLESRQVLEEYLATEALAARARFRERFPVGVNITRAVLDTVQEWNLPEGGL